ncbi:MAG: alkane 1-monooxygenase, partial [Chloroflexi bacterium]|nr:alkane 1-monooxygenase [Chloroflexota bacterium]
TIDDINFDYLIDAEHIVVGSPETVAEQLTRFYHASGGFGTLMFHMGRDYGEPEGRRKSMELFMQEVAPSLRDLNPD